MSRTLLDRKWVELLALGWPSGYRPRVDLYRDTAAGGGSVTGAASLSATATIAVTATVTRGGQASLTGNATLTASAARTRSATVALAGTATLAASAAIVHNVAASLTANATLAAAAAVRRDVSAAFSAQAALAAQAAVERAVAASLTGVATLTATATVVASGATVTAAATLNATATLAASAIAGAVTADLNQPYGTVTDGGSTFPFAFADPSYANDGSYSTIAVSTNTVIGAGTYYRRLKTDLGAPIQATTITAWMGSWNYFDDLQYSLDGVSWTSLGAGTYMGLTLGIGQEFRWSIPADAEARYFRLSATEVRTGLAYVERIHVLAWTIAGWFIDQGGGEHHRIIIIG